jgi:hypothetical protein
MPKASPSVVTRRGARQLSRANSHDDGPDRVAIQPSASGECRAPPVPSPGTTRPGFNGYPEARVLELWGDFLEPDGTIRADDDVVNP